MMSAIAHTNGSARGANNGSAQAGAPWLQSSVQDFFSAFNWEDRPPEIYASSSGQDSGELSLSLSVSQFFAAVSWEGRPAIAAPLLPDVSELESPPPNDLTLDDFFSLF